MFLFRTELRDLRIAGTGVFALEPIPRGAIAGFLNYKVNIVTEEQYQQAQRDGDLLLIQSAVRWIGDYFLHNTENENEDYINHAENANLLYHCGILFATHDIEAEEELTVNYKYFLAVDDVYAFADLDTRKKVSGMPGKEALLQSCRELMELYCDAEIDAPRHSDYKPLK